MESTDFYKAGGSMAITSFVRLASSGRKTKKAFRLRLNFVVSANNRVVSRQIWEGAMKVRFESTYTWFRSHIN